MVCLFLCRLFVNSPSFFCVTCISNLSIMLFDQTYIKFGFTFLLQLMHLYFNCISRFLNFEMFLYEFHTIIPPKGFRFLTAIFLLLSLVLHQVFCIYGLR